MCEFIQRLQREKRVNNVGWRRHVDMIDMNSHLFTVPTKTVKTNIEVATWSSSSPSSVKRIISRAGVIHLQLDTATIQNEKLNSAVFAVRDTWPQCIFQTFSRWQNETKQNEYFNENKNCCSIT